MTRIQESSGRTKHCRQTAEFKNQRENSSITCNKGLLIHQERFKKNPRTSKSQIPERSLKKRRPNPTRAQRHELAAALLCKAKSDRILIKYRKFRRAPSFLNVKRCIEKRILKERRKLVRARSPNPRRTLKSCCCQAL